jgi:hypothetical protein
MGDASRYEIYRGNDRNGYKYVCSVKLEDGVWPVAKEILKKENFEVFYTRSWNHDDGYTYIDYGSHSDFFRYKLVSENETVVK